jgi:hypothetical protein
MIAEHIVTTFHGNNTMHTVNIRTATTFVAGHSGTSLEWAVEDGVRALLGKGVKATCDEIHAALAQWRLDGIEP